MRDDDISGSTVDVTVSTDGAGTQISVTLTKNGALFMGDFNIVSGSPGVPNEIQTDYDEIVTITYADPQLEDYTNSVEVCDRGEISFNKTLLDMLDIWEIHLVDKDLPTTATPTVTIGTGFGSFEEKLIWDDVNACFFIEYILYNIMPPPSGYLYVNEGWDLSVSYNDANPSATIVENAKISTTGIITLNEETYLLDGTDATVVVSIIDPDLDETPFVISLRESPSNFIVVNMVYNSTLGKYIGSGVVSTMGTLGALAVIDKDTITAYYSDGAPSSVLSAVATIKAP